MVIDIHDISMCMLISCALCIIMSLPSHEGTALHLRQRSLALRRASVALFALLGGSRDVVGAVPPPDRREYAPATVPLSRAVGKAAVGLRIVGAANFALGAAGRR